METATLSLICAGIIIYALYFWTPRNSRAFYLQRPFLMSHRGVLQNAPENTSAAFQAAVRAGFKGTELDVMSTADGQVVCSHYFNLEARTNGRGRLSKMSYCELDTVSVQPVSEGSSGERIPLLTDVIDKLPADFRINIEIKTEGPFDLKTACRAARLVSRRKMQDRVIISSFNPLALLAVKFADSSILTGLLIESSRRISLCLINLIHPDCLHPEVDIINDDLLRFARQKNLPVNAWTVNNSPTIDWLIEKGVDGIISDYPEYCRLPQ